MRKEDRDGTERSWGTEEEAAGFFQRADRQLLDSVSKIAREIYGNADEWQRIFEANRDRIEDPDLIEPGQKLKIPG